MVEVKGNRLDKGIKNINISINEFESLKKREHLLNSSLPNHPLQKNRFYLSQFIYYYLFFELL